jgi:hypothetical protein
MLMPALCASLTAITQIQDLLSGGSATEYLAYGEYGVAYELLVFVLDKQHIERPDQLQQAGSEMGLLE